MKDQDNDRQPIKSLKRRFAVPNASQDTEIPKRTRFLALSCV